MEQWHWALWKQKGPWAGSPFNISKELAEMTFNHAGIYHSDWTQEQSPLPFTAVAPADLTTT